MTTPRRCLSRLISSFINATTVYTAFSCNNPLPSAAKKLPVFEIYYFIRVREVNSRIDPRQFVFDEKKKKRREKYLYTVEEFGKRCNEARN